MSRWRPFFVTFALVLFTSAVTPRPAFADMDIGFVDSGEGTAPDTEYTWYGYKGLGFDAAAALVLAGGIASDTLRKPLLVAGVGLYALGAPAAHFARGHEVRGLTSLVLRTAVPLGIGLLTYAGQGCGTERQCDGGDDLMPYIYGTLAAIGLATLDDVFFTWEGHEKPRAPTWSPTVTPSAGGMTFGVVGTF
jgi:hypothetical protein